MFPPQRARIQLAKHGIVWTVWTGGLSCLPSLSYTSWPPTLGWTPLYLSPCPPPIAWVTCSFFRPRPRHGLSGETFPELVTDTCFQSIPFCPMTIYVHLLTVRLLEVGTMSTSSSFFRFLFQHHIRLIQTTKSLQTRTGAWTTF